MLGYSLLGDAPLGSVANTGGTEEFDASALLLTATYGTPVHYIAPTELSAGAVNSTLRVSTPILLAFSATDFRARPLKGPSAWGKATSVRFFEGQPTTSANFGKAVLATPFATNGASLSSVSSPRVAYATRQVGRRFAALGRPTIERIFISVSSAPTRFGRLRVIAGRKVNNQYFPSPAADVAFFGLPKLSGVAYRSIAFHRTAIGRMSLDRGASC